MGKQLKILINTTKFVLACFQNILVVSSDLTKLQSRNNNGDITLGRPEYMFPSA